MLVVVPFHSADAPTLRRLFSWIEALDGKLDHPAVLVCDAATPFREAMETRDAARQVFREVHFTTNGTGVQGREAGFPSLLFHGSIYVASKMPQPFLLLEPDAVPLKKGWLDKISLDYKSKNGNGPLYLTCNITKKRFVYPCSNGEANIESVSSDLLRNHDSPPTLPPTFVMERRHGSAPNVMTRGDIPGEVVLFHRNKDGTLMDCIAQIENIPFRRPSEETQADVVSLRRNGDIVSLLPLLRKMSQRQNRPIKLVVNREFMPVLDGVSYVKGVPWDGEWENPLLAAAQFKARNAQVYGMGKMLGTGRGDFCKQAWELLGARWNRYLPLVFDQRDAAREAALAAAVFKTDKPKILVKMEGHSSPFGERRELWNRLQHWAGRAELVLLDNVTAERLYDLVGLMDRAACLITADTVTLHLAHASKVPVIAYTNGEGFNASPPRGNTIFRCSYTQALPRWMEAVRCIEATLTPESQGEAAVLVFSAFTPRDPDTKRRQDAAYVTWPRLGARQLPFGPKRTSQMLGDPRGMPFIRDMIQAGFASGPEPILILINNDIKVDEKLGAAIRQSCAQFGCFWTYRVDRPGGRTDEGADCFAMTRKFWAVHQHQFPDFLLGYWHFDDCLVRIMRWAGCPERERLCYHEPHPQTQSPTRLQSPGQRHNDVLWNGWLEQWQEERGKPTDT